MSDLRPEHGDSDHSIYKEPERSREVFTFRNKYCPTEIDNWLLLQAFLFKQHMKHFHATSPKIPFIKVILEKYRMKVECT